MATILKGAPVVAAMNERNAALCEQLKAKGITPTLAVVRVGEREDDLSYERGVMTRCGKVGVAVRQFVLPADATQEQLLRVLDEVNTDDGIHGCLLFRPLPKQFDDRTVRAALRPEKDVDGITDGSLAGVFTNTELGYAPCTAQACMEILKYYNVPLSGKRAVVVGRSLVVGIVILAIGAALLYSGVKGKKMARKIFGTVFAVTGALSLLGLTGVPYLEVGVPGILSLYFDIFSGGVQALVFSLLTMVYVGNACPPPEEA